jgi:hypothetical protein
MSRAFITGLLLAFTVSLYIPGLLEWMFWNYVYAPIAHALYFIETVLGFYRTVLKNPKQVWYYKVFFIFWIPSLLVVYIDGNYKK